MLSYNESTHKIVYISDEGNIHLPVSKSFNHSIFDKLEYYIAHFIVNYQNIASIIDNALFEYQTECMLATNTKLTRERLYNTYRKKLFITQFYKKQIYDNTRLLNCCIAINGISVFNYEYGCIYLTGTQKNITPIFNLKYDLVKMQIQLYSEGTIHLYNKNNNIGDICRMHTKTIKTDWYNITDNDLKIMVDELKTKTNNYIQTMAYEIKNYLSSLDDNQLFLKNIC